MHFYQFHIGDYASHTAHLDPLEDIAYRRLIDWCFLHESPLPESIEKIARVIRMQEHCKCIASVLHEFFTLTDEGYHSDRVNAEMEKYREISVKRKAAAEKRWGKKQEKDSKNNSLEGDASALQVQSKSNANQEPRTNNHKPITNLEKSTKKELKSAIDKQFTRFYSAYPKKTEKPTATTRFAKLCAKCKIPEDVEVVANALISDVEKRLELGMWSTEKTQKGFIPNPAKYILQEKWNDEYIEAPTTGGFDQPRQTRTEQMFDELRDPGFDGGNSFDQQDPNPGPPPLEAYETTLGPHGDDLSEPVAIDGRQCGAP